MKYNFLGAIHLQYVLLHEVSLHLTKSQAAKVKHPSRHNYIKLNNNKKKLKPRMQRITQHVWNRKYRRYLTALLFISKKLEDLLMAERKPTGGDSSQYDTAGLPWISVLPSGDPDRVLCRLWECRPRLTPRSTDIGTESSDHPLWQLHHICSCLWAADHWELQGRIKWKEHDS